MSSGTSTSATAGFIDLATYDEAEKYFVGGENAITYFVREVKKTTWFTQVPTVLSKRIGTADFGHSWSAIVSRSGDYMTSNWLRFTVPEVKLNTASNQFVDNGVNQGSIRWTRNIGHNIIRNVTMSFNDLTSTVLDNYHLDFWAAFTVPAGKKNGYNNMIGNIDELTNPIIVGGDGLTLPQHVCNVPLPLHHTRDTGVALPTAALPYNEIHINISFRNWNELLIIDNNVTKVSAVPQASDLLATPSLNINDGPHVWANYILVSNDERKRMGRAPRDILIEQFQTSTPRDIPPSSVTKGSYYTFDIRFSHSVKALFFGVRNTTMSNEWSNYTAGSPVPGKITMAGGNAAVDFNPRYSADPITHATLIYESTKRLDNVPVDYYSLIAPWYHAPVIPSETGYHMYSYSLDFFSVDPMGSTNYGKLTNVSMGFNFSEAAGNAAGAALNTDYGARIAQRFATFCLAVNNNTIRISGGALGFPVL